MSRSLLSTAAAAARTPRIFSGYPPPPPTGPPSHSPSPPSSSPVGKLYLTSSAASPRRHWYADGADNDIHCLRYAQSSLGSHTAVAPQPALSDKLVRVWKRTKSLHETGQELMARTGACQFENRRRYYSGVLTPTRAEWKASKRRSPSHLLMCYAAPEPLELHPVSQPVKPVCPSVCLSAETLNRQHRGLGGELSPAFNITDRAS